jgi:hypothetical protein
MIKIKVSTNSPNFDWKKQTPNNDGIWGNHKFVFYDPSIQFSRTNVLRKPLGTNGGTAGTARRTGAKPYDYWIVYEDLISPETAFCPLKNTILITGEPPTKKKYHPKFLQQFATVVPTTPRYTAFGSTRGERHSKHTALISVICSNKTFTRGHRARIKFIKKLKNYFGNSLDFFGRGFREIDDKWDAIAPYKYHIVLENSFYKNYWTEKLSDAFLASAYPIYYGCPNIHEYFPSGLTQINIHKPEKAFKIIEQIIGNKIYEKNIKNIDQAKKLVLNKYNFFPRMAKFCKPTNFSKKEITLYPQEYFYKQDNFLKKVIRRSKHFFSGEW